MFTLAGERVLDGLDNAGKRGPEKKGTTADAEGNIQKGALMYNAKGRMDKCGSYMGRWWRSMKLFLEPKPPDSANPFSASSGKSRLRGLPWSCG
jgi:hypothetical protein